MLQLAERVWFKPFIWTASLLMLATLSVGTYLNALNGVEALADFTLFYGSALSYLKGGSLYQQFLYTPLIGNPVFLGSPLHPDGLKLMSNLNPPVVSFLFIPFAWLDMRSAYYLFCAGQFAFAFYALSRLLPRHPLAKPVLLLSLSAFFPILANMLLGQVGLLLLALVALSWLALSRAQYRQAGLWLGLALLLKLFVGLLLIWLLLKRQLATLAWATLVFTLGTLAALLVFGFDDHLAWLQVVATYKAGALSWNASLEGLMSRYLGGGALLTYIDWPLLRLALRVISWSGAAAALIWLSRYADLRHGFAFCLPMMLYLAPLGWLYYFPLLLLAVLLLWPKVNGWAIASLICAAIPQLLASGDFFHPQLWKPYYRDVSLIATGPVPEMSYGSVYHWFVLPEVFTLALLFMAIAVMREAYHSRSTQTGA